MNRLRVWNIVGVILAAAIPLHAEPMPWLPAGPRQGETLVVDHQPHRYGGLASDTEFIEAFGPPSWQRVADDFRLNATAEISRITVWGFYGHSFEPAPDPPSTETMRVRIYGVRPTDGLPGEVLLEESLLDPVRTPTGFRIADGGLPLEYDYSVPLTHHFLALADTSYWLEFVQIGDSESYFRWEFSMAEANGQAGINPRTVDWRSAGISADTAFQLWAVPEPATSIMVLLGMCALWTSRKRHRQKEVR